MTITRRGLAAFGTSVLAAPPLALAAEWPSERPIQVVVPFPPGGGVDQMARLLLPHVERQLPGAQFVVDNRAGAGGQIGSEVAFNARPDGYTLGAITSPALMTIAIERRVRYRVPDFSYIANVVDDPSGLWVAARLPLSQPGGPAGGGAPGAGDGDARHHRHRLRRPPAATEPGGGGGGRPLRARALRRDRADADRAARRPPRRGLLQHERRARGAARRPLPCPCAERRRALGGGRATCRRFASWASTPRAGRSAASSARRGSPSRSASVWSRPSAPPSPTRASGQRRSGSTCLCGRCSGTTIAAPCWAPRGGCASSGSGGPGGTSSGPPPRPGHGVAQPTSATAIQAPIPVDTVLPVQR